jgi:hypothetical protein
LSENKEVMRLTSTDGSFFEMEALGYEFENVGPSAVRDIDLNWLNFRIHARNDSGEWTAEFPVAKTDELIGFAGWLEERSSGKACYGLYGFMEPVLWFEARRATGRRITLFVNINGELRPEWNPRIEGCANKPITLEFTVGFPEILTAAKAVREMTKRFPERPWDWKPGMKIRER